YRQRRRKQRSLNQDPKIPHLRVTLGQLCGAGFGSPSLMYLRGDVGHHHLGAFDGPVRADAGTDDDIAANLLHGSRSVEVELETPLPPLLDLSRAINPVENLDQVLTFEFGKYLARRYTQPHHGKRGSHRSICGHITVFRTCERDDEVREAVERTPDDLCFTDRVVQIRVVRHGF